jgi:endonuclease/exonuclease/phosphatase family metal-dependent hydrolase
MWLRVATWNVRRARHDDIADVVKSLEADILVLQEIPRAVEAAEVFGATDVSAVGTDERTQLAVFTFGQFEVGEPPTVTWQPRDLMWTLPVQIEGPTPIRLLGVWADNSAGDHRPATKAIRHLVDDWPGKGPQVVAGDFNHHRKWDHVGYNDKDHKLTVDLLASLGLVSAYHRSRGIGESRVQHERCDDRSGDQVCSHTGDAPTFWQHGHDDKPHHIDYIYAPAEFIREKATDVTVGSYPEVVACGLSDHAPVVASIQIPDIG